MIDPHNGAFDGIERDHTLLGRRDAAQATLDAWKGRPLRLGEWDCARMAASHLRRLGYQVRLPAARTYRTARSAIAAMRKLGHEDLAGALDALGLVRIAPAAAIVGDIIQMPSEVEALGALTIVMGNGRVAGWHGDGARSDGGFMVLQPLSYVAAWRVDPKD
jgi:hypothetical protein